MVPRTAFLIQLQEGVVQVSVVPTAAICWEAPDTKLTVGAFDAETPEPSGTPLNATVVTAVPPLLLLLLALLLLALLLLALLLLALLLLALLLLPLLLALLFVLFTAPVINEAVGLCCPTLANCWDPPLAKTLEPKA